MKIAFLRAGRCRHTDAGRPDPDMLSPGAAIDA